MVTSLNQPKIATIAYIAIAPKMMHWTTFLLKCSDNWGANWSIYNDRSFMCKSTEWFMKAIKRIGITNPVGCVAANWSIGCEFVIELIEAVSFYFDRKSAKFRLAFSSPCCANVVFKEPPVGIEPTTVRLRSACSANWAKKASVEINMEVGTAWHVWTQ